MIANKFDSESLCIATIDKQCQWHPVGDQGERPLQASSVSDDGSTPKILSRIAQATAAPTKLKLSWRDNNISFGSNVKLMHSLVISMFLYACESWALTAELQKRMQAFEMRCYQRLLNILCKDHVTNGEAHRKIQTAIREYYALLTLVKKRKLSGFGYVSRSSDLAKTILQETIKGKRRRGRQKKRLQY